MKLHHNPGSEPVTQDAGMIAALSHIDGAGFHGIDTALRGASAAIEPSWASHTRHARIAAASVSWPDELLPRVKTFTDAAGRLAAALDVGDPTAAAGPAREAHEAWHTLNAAAWNYLARTAGMQEEGKANQHRHHHQAP